MNLLGYEIDPFSLYVIVFFWSPLIAAMLCVGTYITCRLRRASEKKFNERQEMLTQLANEALRVSSQDEERAFVRKLEQHRPRLTKDEKEKLMRYITCLVYHRSRTD